MSVKVKHPLCWKHLSVEAACLIVKQQTVSVYAFYCLGKNTLSLYAEINFCLVYASHAALNPLPPLNVIWHSSVNKSNNEWPLMHARSSFLKEDYLKASKRLTVFLSDYMSSVFHSYVLVCHPYVTRMYSYAIRRSLVCTRMISVCHSYVLSYHSYVIRLWF